LISLNWERIRVFDDVSRTVFRRIFGCDVEFTEDITEFSVGGQKFLLDVEFMNMGIVAGSNFSTDN
jgi:hypothetical protein